MPIPKRVVLDVLYVFAVVKVVHEVVVVAACQSVADTQVDGVEGSVHVSDESECCGSECLKSLLLIGVDSDVEGSRVAMGFHLPVEESAYQWNLSPRYISEGFFMNRSPPPLRVVKSAKPLV